MDVSAVALLLITPDDKILMQLRDDKPTIYFPNHWCIFTGSVEDKDDQGNIDATMRHAVRREISEELHVKTPRKEIPFVPPELSLFYTGNYRYDFGLRTNQYVFQANLYVPLDKLVLKEGKKLQLFDRKDIRSIPVAANYAMVIEHYFTQRSRRPLTAFA